MTVVRYAALFAEQPEGGYTVTFPDFPEAITEGDSRQEAMFHAIEVLTLCLEQRLEEGEETPTGKSVKGGIWIEPSAAVQTAIQIRQARRAQGKTLADLARALDTSWPTAQRLESPKANPTLHQLERAAAALGLRLVVNLEAP